MSMRSRTPFGRYPFDLDRMRHTGHSNRQRARGPSSCDAKRAFSGGCGQYSTSLALQPDSQPIADGIGRVELRAELALGALRTAGLVTLVAMRGVGNSRLAVHTGQISVCCSQRNWWTTMH